VECLVRGQIGEALLCILPGFAVCIRQENTHTGKYICIQCIYALLWGAVNLTLVGGRTSREGAMWQAAQDEEAARRLWWNWDMRKQGWGDSAAAWLLRWEPLLVEWDLGDDLSDLKRDFISFYGTPLIDSGSPFPPMYRRDSAKWSHLSENMASECGTLSLGAIL
jgi:hypothetical protein